MRLSEGRKVRSNSNRPFQLSLFEHTIQGLNAQASLSFPTTEKTGQVSRRAA